ncbi:MAG: glycine zipper 2TM domain-containing protein [Herminiimonas sp.]|nr:glycine zipper 2TM domain-containing protein [Herminiimonas sp.]
MSIQRNTVMALVAFSAFSAAYAGDFDDFGRVVSVSPQIEQFNQPRQECRNEYVQVQRQPQQQQRGIGGSIIGGLAGGLLGNQVGGGSGRSVATAAGAIAGAIAGDRVENNQQMQGAQQFEEQQVRQCRMVDHWESRTNGYAVTYEYNGRNFTSVLPYDPGQRVKVHVAVTPRP